MFSLHRAIILLMAIVTCTALTMRGSAKQTSLTMQAFRKRTSRPHARASKTRGLKWKNWDGLQTCALSQYIEVNSEADIIAAVNNANTNKLSLKVVGAGHSFSGVAVPRHHGIMLSLDGYNAVLDIDHSTRRVTFQAGIRLYDVERILDDHGLALPNTGAISLQSLAGAISTATHGTGKYLGSLASAVVAFTMVLANGTVVSASTTENTELFHAGVVSIGALGVFSTMTLQTVPTYHLEHRVILKTLPQLLGEVEGLHETYDRFQWNWIPFKDKARAVLRIPTNASVTGCWEKKWLEAEGGSHYCVDISYKVTSRNGNSPLVYTEIEYFVDVKDAMAVVHEFLKAQRQLGSQQMKKVPKFTGVRYIAPDSYWLSPMYQRPSAAVSFMVFGDATRTGNNQEFQKFARRLSSIAHQYQGRPHWGKMHWATKEYLATVYPKLPDFIALAKSLDPEGIFVNEYLSATLGL